MKRTVIYARFSTELQHERSIDDQIDLCRTHAERNDLEIVGVYEDRARSGASIFGRDGLMRLMDAARDKAFDVVPVEALDRLSRDQQDLAGIWKRLSFLGVKLRAVHDGKADQIQIGIRGLVGALYLQDLAHKVRRGMAGVIRDGRHAGGRAYGYRPVPGKPGELTIIDDESDIVRQIFADYTDGKTPREIAASLNTRKVAPPRGQFWTASAINGSLTRHNGILLNEIYAGRIIWNRLRMIKDPDTGRRVSRPNPRAEWQIIEAPHLQIVDQDIWEKAQAIKQARGGPHAEHKRKPRHVLSGLLKCKSCGSGMSIKDKRKGRTRIQCTQMKEAGTCDHRRAYHLQAIERTVFDGLRANLTDPRLIAAYVETYNEERKRLASDLITNRAKIERRLTKASGELERAIDMVVKGIVTADSMRDRIKELQDEKAQLEADLLTAEKPPEFVTLHPATIERYRQQIEDLAQTLNTQKQDSHEPITAFRELVHSIVVAPTEAGKPLQIEVRGRLAAVIGHDVFPQARMWGGTVVAEEATTFSMQERAGASNYCYVATG